MGVEFKVASAQRGTEYLFFPEDITINAEMNGRHELPDIEWLIADILKNGQIQRVTVYNDAGTPVLAAGFSRWRAISAINERGLLPNKLKIKCTAVKVDQEQAFLMNIAENRFRNEVSALDDAHNIQKLTNVWQYTEERIAAVYFPTAKTEPEMKQAVKFVRDRLQLISLTPEAKAAVTAGKIKPNAVLAISKLSAKQQKETLKAHPEGIDRKDLRKEPKAAKPSVADAELRRRCAVMLEVVEGLLEQKAEWVEVKIADLVSIRDYMDLSK